MTKKMSSDNNDLEKVIDFLFEVGILSKTPRSGFHFLGSGSQSVAEHVNRTCFIAYALAQMNNKADVGKAVQMALFHDISETRISDLNYVHQKYTERLEEKAHSDLVVSIPFGDDVKKILDEYEKRESLESKLSKDADTLEWIISLKEQVDIGNTRAEEWIPTAIKRLTTPEAKKLVDIIIKTESNRWWFGDKNDSWWVNRGGKDKKWLK